MEKVKRDDIELTEKGKAIFDEAIVKVEKAYEKWRKFYKKYKESTDETNKTP